MNDAKCCAAVPPVEPLNGLAQDIIDSLTKVNDLSKEIDERLYGCPARECHPNQPAPANLCDKLLCIRNLVGEIGNTLNLVQGKL